MITGKPVEHQLFTTFPKDDWYHKYYYDLRKVAWNCSRCSACKWIDSWEVKEARFAKVCPSNARYLYDAYSCQGRMDITLALLDGRLKYDDIGKLLEVYYKCNTCGGCDISCKRNNDMEPLRVMLDTRARLVEEGLLLPQHVSLLDSLKREDNTVMGIKANRGRWAEGLGIKDLTVEKGEVVFHAGCHISFDESQWGIARATVNLIKNSNIDIGIFGKEETCCGGKMYDIGYRGEFTKYAENNIEAWKNAGVKTVVTTCADCYYAFKHLYPAINGRFEVLHVVEYLDRLLKDAKLKFKKSLSIKVTYHDPCHIGRRDNDQHYEPGKSIMGLYEQPRNIIRSIPGVNFVEMFRIKENSWCCGAGGGVREAYPDFYLWTAMERVKEAEAVDAEAIVTACPWCERAFIDAIGEMKNGMKVYDILELVNMAQEES